MLSSLRSNPSAKAACTRTGWLIRSVHRPNLRCFGSKSAEEIIAAADAAKLKELERRFKTADIDGNGFIDREELRTVLQATDGGDEVMFTEFWLPEDELDRVMAAYDKDGNGVIDFEEFKNIAYDGLLLDDKLSEYEEAFKAVDKSGNGTIGATELAQLFQSLGTPLSYEKLSDVMEKYDKDESGQIEFGEFLLMFRDQLLDLKAVKNYMGSLDDFPTGTGQVLDAPEGDIALIFSQAELDEVLAASKGSGKAAVVFCALTWCRPCKGMQRPAQKLADAYAGKTMWVKLFGNANEQTKKMFKEQLKVRSTPCFIVFKDGEVAYTQTGTNKEKLEAGLRAALGPEGLPQPLYATVEAAA